MDEQVAAAIWTHLDALSRLVGQRITGVHAKVGCFRVETLAGDQYAPYPGDWAGITIFPALPEELSKLDGQPNP